MKLTRELAREVLDIYIKAWVSQDPDLIVTIFTESATYHERVLEDPIPDRAAIRRYWEEKVVRSQANIDARLLAFYLDGDTVIAEWQAEFDDMVQGMRKRMREVAILEFDGRLIASLREYWASEQIGRTQAGGDSVPVAQPPAFSGQFYASVNSDGGPVLCCPSCPWQVPINGPQSGVVALTGSVLALVRQHLRTVHARSERI